jgi:DNA glycosylase AlkZ-like
MDLKDIARLRLISQQLAVTQFSTVKDLVHWMGAMQAQDYVMLQWAVALRLKKATDKTLDAAISQGQVIRTHLMRPTWHLVAAADIYWMLELTSAHILSGIKSRHRNLELTDAMISKSNRAIIKALEKAQMLTRPEINTELEKTGIINADNRFSHLLLLAELDGIICSGPVIKGKQTYALLEERVPQKNKLSRDEALATLAGKYFNSHYPATIDDFIWWSGLPVKDAKKALQINQGSFIAEKIAGQEYWMPVSSPEPSKSKDKVYLLPAYDEFLISYRDRTASLPFEMHNKTVSNNGIFRPALVVDGQVTGIWRRILKKDTFLLETEMFKTVNNDVRQRIQKAALSYGKFLDKNIEITDKK